MSHGQNLRDLLAPLGVYRWEGSFQWGELQSEGEALDQVAEQVALLQREMNLYTAQAEGLTGLLELLGLERAGETLEELRQTVAALLRIGGDSFTLAAMNDTLRAVESRPRWRRRRTRWRWWFPFPVWRGSRRDLSRQRPGLRRFCPVISW